MLNDIIYVIKNIFNYIKHFTLIFIKFLLTSDYRKGFSFFICAIFFYLLYLLLGFIFSNIKINNKQYDFINSKHNIFLKSIIILISSLIFFLLIFREDKVDENNAKKYFEDIFKKPDVNYNFYSINKEVLSKKINNPLKNIFFTAAIIFFITFFSTFLGVLFIYILTLFKETTNILLFFIILSIIITILTVLAIIFKISLKSNTCNNINEKNIFKKILCIAYNIIFFIPCLLIIFADFIKKEFMNTSPTIFIILLLQVFVILFIYLIPELYNLATRGNRILKRNEILYLNEKKQITNYFNLNKKFNKKKSKTLFEFDKYKLQYKTHMDSNDYQNKNKFDYNYIIDFELYINPQGTNTSLAYNQETTLFDYGNKPIFLYDGRTQEIIIKSRHLNKKDIELDTIHRLKANSTDNNKHFKFQKWNKFTVKYYDFTIEILLDNKIIAVKKNIPTFDSNDTIVIGEENGIHGGIKNIYYKTFSNNDWKHNNSNENVSLYKGSNYHRRDLIKNGAYNLKTLKH